MKAGVCRNAGGAGLGGGTLTAGGFGGECARMRNGRAVVWMILATVLSALVGACMSPPGHPNILPTRAGAAVAADGTPIRAPFYYEPLNVRNGCFVESVRVYDQYLSRHLGGDRPWVKVLQWGSRESDTKVGLGHAVAIFVWRDDVWTYDINHAFTRLAVPVGRRADLTDVTPEIFARYPKQQPVLARYWEDGFQHERTEVPEYLFYHANQEVREATRVASELGRFRPVRVLAFQYTEGGKLKNGAAAVFLFGNRICIYFPAKGTQIGLRRETSADDLRLLGLMLKQQYPDATDVKWHAGGYWLTPPKS